MISGDLHDKGPHWPYVFQRFVPSAALALPCRALPCTALPCHALPCLPSPALVGLAAGRAPNPRNSAPGIPLWYLPPPPPPLKRGGAVPVSAGFPGGSQRGGGEGPTCGKITPRHPFWVLAPPPPCIRRVGCVQVSGTIPGGSQRGIVHSQHFTIPGGQNPDPYFLFEPPSRWLGVNIPQFPGRYLRSQVLLSPGPFSPPVLIFARGCNGVCAIGLTEPTAMRLITLRKT